MRKIRNYDVSGLFTFFTPSVGFSWIMTGICLVLQLGVGVLFALPFMLGYFGADLLQLVTYTLTFALLLLPCASFSRFNAMRMQEGIAISGGKHLRAAGGFVPLALLVIVGTFGTVIALDPINTAIAKIPLPGSDLMEQFMKLILEGNPWIWLINLVILAPLFEETFCRGILLRGMLKTVKPHWAIILSALMFAVIHGNIIQGVNAFLLGCIIGYAYYKTGNIWLAMLMHATNNLMSFLLLYTPLAQYDSLLDVMPVWGYILLVIGGIALAAGFIRLLRRIPLQGDYGNLDRVRFEDLVPNAKPDYTKNNL